VHTDTLVIERDVPLPAPRTPVRPYSELSIGDSFVIPRTMCVAATRASASAYAKRHGITLAVRQDADGVARVWRLA
jgi:hypothetical protein